MRPTPNPDQLAAIEAEVQQQQNQQNALLQSAQQQDAIIEQKEQVDSIFKELFDFYNLDIIQEYDKERRAISGTFVPSPVVESDILGVAASPPTGRLVPNPPDTDVVRITEFDGAAYTGFTIDHEQYYISNQANLENVLENGLSFTGTLPPDAEATSLNPTSTEVTITSDTSSIVININDEFVVLDSINNTAVAVRALSSDSDTGPGPDYEVTVDVEFIVEGTTISGSDAKTFTGFNNTERTNKTANLAAEQPLMNALVSELENLINERINKIDEQIDAINGNLDEEGEAEFTAALSENNSSKNFLTNYLITTDISDTGLGTLETERNNRSTYLTARLGEIVSAYTNRTENYYNARYAMANNRGNTQRGTLRVVQNAKDTKSVQEGLAGSIDDSLGALNSVL